MKNLPDIAKQLHELQEKICLIYAFNATGKTRLSVAYKDYTKTQNEGNHAGIYYNAFSEDLFVWDNDEEHDNENAKIDVVFSSLNQFHSLLMDTDLLEEKLSLYHPRYKFNLNLYEDGDREKGIRSITFFVDEKNQTPIKISRGEERIFIWCFFLALFDADAWAGEQEEHFFIDDPVSSLDEHNIFVTVETIFDLIVDTYPKKKIFVTTHHIGLFSILADRLTKGAKSSKFESGTKLFVLGRENNDELILNTPNNDVFLFHLHLLQTLDIAIKTELFAYHFVLLRQLLESICSFLGKHGIGYILQQIGIDDTETAGNVINSLSHKNAYRLQFNKMSPAEEVIFKDIFSKIQIKYKFKF
jgi:AAA domain